MQFLCIFMAIYERPVRPLSHLPASPVQALCIPCATYGNQRGYLGDPRAMFGQPLSVLCASPVPPLCHHRRPMATNCDHRTHLLPSDHCATTVPPFCNHGNASASILPPLSNLYEINILGDHCATVLNMFKTSRRPWRPWRCLSLLFTTFERPMQPFCLL